MKRADFDVPGGVIFGAALSHDATVFYAQQYLNDSTGEHQHIVRLSSWDIKHRIMLTSVSFAETQQAQTIPCRRTLLGANSGRLYICSDRGSVRVLDGKTLTVLRAVAPSSKGTIHDFAIDESRDRLYLLTGGASGVLVLDELELSSGSLIKEATLSGGVLETVNDFNSHL